MQTESPQIHENPDEQHSKSNFSPKNRRSEFICGVVEGFYGRPWTLEQRKHLFARLNHLGLNTYVYAPKDDLKHRPQWRIPYNNEEAEYCESRAVPCLEESDYLLTLGKDLVKDVHILWTGPRVISRHITVEHARNVAKVIGRKPLIWDNLHANDYDQKRVFMGDFSGRPVALKKEVAGLLMNPSCKYELNFIPLRTYADWNASEEDAPFTDLANDEEDDKSSQKMDSSQSMRFYDPMRSLRNAITLWIDEFNCISNRTVPPLPRPDANVNQPDNAACDAAPSTDRWCFADFSDFSIYRPKFQPIEDEPTVNSLTADYGEPMETSVPSSKKFSANQC
ncbi:hyaluronoglucosaminidase [Necator americanus]|uniref:Hyaluronoglucosaminidase n=1 Tax=Necator americanus TaxID=51031 RepID=W2SJN7_NECAM|nr:hyaluronoglucosaminidase [Necator americanus]ETN69805.1 hyaluronoglucosaminidase [Necator americanus]